MRIVIPIDQTSDLSLNKYSLSVVRNSYGKYFKDPALAFSRNTCHKYRLHLNENPKSEI